MFIYLCLTRISANNTNLGNPLPIHLEDYYCLNYAFLKIYADIKTYTWGCNNGKVSKGFLKRQCGCLTLETEWIGRELEAWAQDLVSPSMWPWASPLSRGCIFTCQMKLFQGLLLSLQVFVKIKLESREQRDCKHKIANKWKSPEAALPWWCSKPKRTPANEMTVNQYAGLILWGVHCL